MAEITYPEVIRAFESGQYIKAVQQAHDFCQMALYETMISALDLLGDSDQAHFLLRKNMNLSGNSTLKKPEIQLAVRLGVITEEEEGFIRRLKDLRDSGPAHNSLFYEKEVAVDETRKKKIEEHIAEGERFINALLKKRAAMAAKRLQEGIDIMNAGHKVGDFVQRRVWSREDISLILQEDGLK